MRLDNVCNRTPEIMTPAEFAEKMQGIVDKYDKFCFDEECCHIDHDELMCKLLTQLGYGEGVAIFNDVPKYYA